MSKKGSDPDLNVCRKIEIPLLSRQGSLSSFDEVERTAEMVFSTGAKVRRFDFFFGEYIEEVSMRKESADLSRVESGAVPFLKNHGSREGYLVEDTLGRIVSAEVDGERGVAKVLFSRRPDVLPLIQDIKDQVLRSVSMGYAISEMEKVGERDGVPVLRATQWRLLEISLVAIPADADAQMRELHEGKKERLEEQKLFPCVVRGLSDEEFDAMRKRAEAMKVALFGASPEGEKTPAGKEEVENDRSLDKDRNTGEIFAMTEEQKRELEAKQAAEAKAKVESEKKIEQERLAAREAEKTRQAEIRKVCRTANLGEEFAEKLISEDVDAAKARELAFEEMAKRDEVNSTRSVRIEAGSQDEVGTRREALKEAILHRGAPEVFKVTERAKDYVGMTLIEMARESLRRSGVSVRGLSRGQIADLALKRGMHTGSDFPEITADIINKSLRQAYQIAPATFAPFTRRVSVPDFKQISRVQLGHGSDLVEVTDGGEIKAGTVSESAEKYSVKEYARRLSITRKTLINDDLDAFVRLPAIMGGRARRLEAKEVWAEITDNELMADGNALFSVAHANFTSPGAAPSVTTLATGRSAMRQQKDLDGDVLNLEPRWLWVPTSLETVGEQLVASIQPQEAGKVNPFGQGGRMPLQLIVEPLLDANSATAWYLSAGLDQVDMVELATLEGSGEPEVMSEEEFDTLGMKFRVVHTIGVKAIDYRGLYKNAGV